MSTTGGATGLARLLALVLALVAAAPARAASSAPSLPVTMVLVDDAGLPVADAVLTLHVPGVHPRSGVAVMNQRDGRFVPHVLPVQTGTAVRFPNRDVTLHHVYSFSDAKRFEIRLYSGEPSSPVVFDRPGVVVLGCNIHDDMLAYVYVADTPFFGTTDADGRVSIDLPAGVDFDYRIWHPHLRGDPIVGRAVDTRRLDVAVEVDWPSDAHHGLSPLERKFGPLREPTS